MSRYLVTEAHAARLEILLQDSCGRLHRVEMNDAAPALGTVLHGPAPGCGFVWLQCEDSAQVFAGHFVERACQRAQVLRRWQALAPLQVLPKRALAAETQASLALPLIASHFSTATL